MTRLRHSDPPRDRSHIETSKPRHKKLSKNEKKRLAQQRRDNLDTRPTLTVPEKRARQYEANKKYLAENPARLIVGSPKRRAASKKKK